MTRNLTEEKPALNVVGVLCGSQRLFFRIYAENHSFVDYALQVSALCIQIEDTDSAFYDFRDRNKGLVLDHSPNTLGRDFPQALPSNGTAGTLHKRSDGNFFFRVIDIDGAHNDYELHHSELQVRILDANAALYREPDSSVGVLDSAGKATGSSTV